MSLHRTRITALHHLLLVASLLPAVLCAPAEHTEGRTAQSDEICRFKYCALMPVAQQDKCCSVYKQCCAYVELRRNRGPFSFVESGEVATIPQPTTTRTTYIPSNIYVGPPRSMRLREEAKPPSLSLTRHHHHHNHHRFTTPQPRPAIHLLGAGEDLMKTSYNDQMVKDHQRLCVHSYCGLLSPSQHKLCCNIYDECCAYSNYHIYYDPFHPENGRRRR